MQKNSGYFCSIHAQVLFNPCLGWLFSILVWSLGWFAYVLDMCLGVYFQIMCFCIFRHLLTIIPSWHLGFKFGGASTFKGIGVHFRYSNCCIPWLDTGILCMRTRLGIVVGSECVWVVAPKQMRGSVWRCLKQFDFDSCFKRCWAIYRRFQLSVWVEHRWIMSLGVSETICIVCLSSRRPWRCVVCRSSAASHGCSPIVFQR